MKMRLRLRFNYTTNYPYYKCQKYCNPQQALKLRLTLNLDAAADAATS